ncbi:hypothetical protein ES703_65524 [subsurface metagenome]
MWASAGGSGGSRSSSTVRVDSGSPFSSRAIVSSGIVIVKSPASEVASMVSCITPSSSIENSPSSPNRLVSIVGGGGGGGAGTV